MVGYNLATFTEGRKSKSQQTNNTKNKLLTGIVTIAITVILPVIVYFTGSIKDSTSTPTGTSSPDSSIEKLEGYFDVDAKNREGYKFTNPQNKVAKINFQANGRWVAQPGRSPGSIDAEGYTKKDGTPLYYTDSLLDSAPGASLIVRYDNQSYEYVGKDKTLILKPKESIYFLMNDDVNLYRDNEGKITVTWSVINSAQ